jgi:aminoglycoside phosphotransferase (APT) family kinase protein
MLSTEPNSVVPPEIVLRLDNPGSAQNTAVRDEFPVMRKMYENGICAPEPLWLETDPDPLGAPFLAMRRMAGAAPGTFWSADGVSPALGLALADVLAAIHRQGASTIWSRAPMAARDAVAEMVSHCEMGWRAEISSVTTACALNWLKRHLSCIDGFAAPVHGDVHFGNVLAEGDRLVCLTDWEFAHPGHPAEDLAFCRSYVEQVMPWRDFMAHYIAKGGAPIAEEQLHFFAIWGQLRNIAFGAGVLGSIANGAIPDVQSLSIALHSRAKLEAGLSQCLALAFEQDTDLLDRTN